MTWRSRRDGYRGKRSRGTASAGVFVVAAGAAMGSSGPTVAQAQSEAALPPVIVESKGCESGAAAEVASILRVELLSRVVDSSLRRDAYRTTIDCAGDVVGVAVAAAGGATKGLQVSLARTPANVRSRIVALSIAELVRDLDREPHPAAASPPMVESVAPPARQPAPTEVHTRADSPSSPVPEAAFMIAAFGQVTTFQLDGEWLAGGGLRLDYAARRWCAGVDAAVLTARERFDPGTAQVVLGYGSPYVAWLARWARVQLRLGAGYALGAATISGHATDARAFGGTTTGPWTAPYALAAVSLALTGAVHLDAKGEAGGVTSPVVGNVTGGADVALKGFLASFQAGVTLAL